MPQLSALAEGGTQRTEGGRLRRIRVTPRPDDAESCGQIPVALVIAGLVGILMGVVGANPSLVAGWLN